MGKPPKVTTPLGNRLVALRGDLSRAEFAEKIGVHVNTLGGYERGERSPDLDFLRLIKSATGVDLDWLATGEGAMFDAPHHVTEFEHGYDVMILAKLGDAVQAVFLQVKQSAPPRAITTEAGKLYNELLGMVKDIRDEKVVEAMIPVLRERFKERIENAAPGAGKRSA